MKRIDTNLLVAHADFIRGVARSLVRDVTSADDVTQQVWMAALENPPDRPDSIRSWLAAVTANLSRKYARAAGRREVHEHRARDEHRATRDDTAPSAAHLVETHEIVRQVAEAVSSLDEPYRTVILLRYYDDRTPTQIAEQLDVSLDTVKTRLRRAREKLAARLDALHENRQAWITGLTGFVAGTLPGGVTSPSASEELLGDHASGATRFGPETWLGAAATIASGIVILALLWNRDSPQSGTSDEAIVAVSEERTLSNATEPERSASSAVRSETDSAERSAASPVRNAESPTESTDATTGSLELHVVFESDGAPAADVRARIEPHFTSLPTGPQMRWTTDEHGVLRARGLPPGTKSVTVGRCHTSATLDIVAGETTTATMTLPPGRQVSGVVTNRSGDPVPGAAIFLFRYEFDPGYAVAHTDAKGRFEVRDVSVGCWVGARHRILTPSAKHLSLGFKVGSESLALELGDEGGRVTGTVLDPGGEPVSGAWVRLGTRARGQSIERADGSVGLEPPSPAVLTDASGHFEFFAVESAETCIVATRPGAATAHEKVEVRAGLVTDVTLTVGIGARIEGTVLDGDGAPAADAIVRIRSVVVDTIEAPRETRTGPDGSFALDLVPTGEVWIEATGADERGAAGARLDAAAGETLRWNATLSDGNVLEGRVVGPDDKPLAGWTLRGRAAGMAPPQCPLPPISDRWNRESTTDAGGRFALTNCPPGALHIDILSPHTETDGGGSVIVAERHDLRAGEGFAIIRLDEDDVPGSSLSGRLIPRAGVPIAGLPVMAHRTSSVFPQRFTTHTDTEGRFRFGPILGGRYVLAARHEHDHDIVLGEFLVENGDEHDVGTLTIAESGRMSGSCKRHGVSIADRPDVRIYDAFGMPVRPATLRGDTIETLELEAGRYTLRFNGFARDRIAAAMVPFEVRAGEDTEIEVDLYPGAARTFCMHEADGTQGHATRVRFHIFDHDGVLLWEGIVRRARDTKHGESFRMRAYLTPGSYTAEAVTDAGTTGRTAFEIRSADEPIASVCIHAR